MTVVQDTKSTNVDLVVKLPEIDILTGNWSNVSSNIVISDVDSILKIKSQVEDDNSDMLEDEDETLEEYVEEEVIKFKEDDDINDGGDIQDISSDDE